MSKEYKNPICRGSIMLGTACGHCERCEDERLAIQKAKMTEEPATHLRKVNMLIITEGISLSNLTSESIEEMNRADFILSEGDQVLKNSFGPRGVIVDPNRVCKGDPRLGTGCLVCSSCIPIVKEIVDEYRRSKGELY